MSPNFVYPSYKIPELYSYWAKINGVNTPLTALLLNSGNYGLDSNITDYIIVHNVELGDMCGRATTFVLMIPIRRKDFISEASINLNIKISHEIGRTFGVTPDEFPSIVCFDNISQSKQALIILLPQILGAEPKVEEISAFLHTLLELMRKLTEAEHENLLLSLDHAIRDKWENSRIADTDFSRLIEIPFPPNRFSYNINKIIGTTAPESPMLLVSIEPQDDVFFEQVTQFMAEVGEDVWYPTEMGEEDNQEYHWGTPYSGEGDLEATITQVAIALGSAGVFSTLYQAIGSYISRNQSREITLEKGKTKITIKGHSLPEEQELLKKLAPELLPKQKESKKRRLTKRAADGGDSARFQASSTPKKKPTPKQSSRPPRR